MEVQEQRRPGELEVQDTAKDVGRADRQASSFPDPLGDWLVHLRSYGLA